MTPTNKIREKTMRLRDKIVLTILTIELAVLAVWFAHYSFTYWANLPLR